MAEFKKKNLVTDVSRYVDKPSSFFKRYMKQQKDEEKKQVKNPYNLCIRRSTICIRDLDSKRS